MLHKTYGPIRFNETRLVPHGPPSMRKCFPCRIWRSFIQI